MKPVMAGLLCEAQPWLDYLRANGRSPETLKNYERAIGMADRFWAQTGAPRGVRSITVHDLRGWFRECERRRYAPTGRDSFLRPLTLFLRWLEARGEIFVDPSRQFLLRSPARRMVPVHSEKDIARVLDATAGSGPIELRDQAILEVAYATGVRKAELTAMNVADLNLRDRLLKVQGKGAKERVLPLTRKAVTALQSYLEAGRPLLMRGQAAHALWLADAAHGSGRLCRSGITILFRRRGRAAGLRLSPHDLRRAFATHMLRRGLGVNELRLLLGHSGFQHIRHYVRYAAVDLKRAHRRSKLSR